MAPEEMIFVGMFALAFLIILIAVALIGSLRQQMTLTPPADDGVRVLSAEDRAKIVQAVKTAFITHRNTPAFLWALGQYATLFPLICNASCTRPILTKLSPPGKKWVQFTVALTSDPTKEETVTVWLP